MPQFLMKMALEVSKTRHFFRCAGYRGGLRPESATLTTTIIHAQSGAPVDAPGAGDHPVAPARLNERRGEEAHAVFSK